MDLRTLILVYPYEIMAACCGFSVGLICGAIAFSSPVFITAGAPGLETASEKQAESPQPRSAAIAAAFTRAERYLERGDVPRFNRQVTRLRRLGVTKDRIREYFDK